MSEPTSDTSTFLKTQDSNSCIWGVSVRAWIAIGLVITVCLNQLTVVLGIVVNAVLTKDWSLVGTFANIGEPLYSMGVAALGFYFGQKTSTK